MAVLLGCSNTLVGYGAADTEVMVNVSVANTGNTRLQSITLTSATWTAIKCGGSGTGTIALLNPGDTLYCSANYTMTQSSYEGASTSSAATDSLSTTITAASANLTAQGGQVDLTVGVPTAYTAAMVVTIDSCSLPSDASGVCLWPIAGRLGQLGQRAAGRRCSLMHLVQPMQALQ